MNVVRSLELMKKYSKCLNCGSDSLGNGEGTMNIDEDTFTRTCKCGWGITEKEEVQ